MRSIDPVPEILQLVAAAENVGPLALPPLYDAVDPDALVRVLDADSRVRVEFTYLSYRVVVDESGEVTLYPENGDI